MKDRQGTNVRDLRQRVTLKPSDAVARHELGLAYVEKGMLVRGTEEFVQATRLAPTFAEAWHDLALAHQAVGDVASYQIALSRMQQLDAHQVICARLKLDPYVEWPLRSLPGFGVLVTKDIADGLLEIVASEAPISVDRLFERYASASGHGRLGTSLLTALKGAVAMAVAKGWLLRDSLMGGETVVRGPSTQPVLSRERGPRRLAHVPSNELLEVARRLRTLHRLASGAELLGLFVACYVVTASDEAELGRLRDALTGATT